MKGTGAARLRRRRHWLRQFSVPAALRTGPSFAGLAPETVRNRKEEERII